MKDSFIADEERDSFKPNEGQDSFVPDDIYTQAAALSAGSEAMGQFGEAALSAPSKALNLVGEALSPLRIPSIGLGGIAASMRGGLQEGAQSIKEKRGLGAEELRNIGSSEVDHPIVAAILEMASDPAALATPAIGAKVFKMLGQIKNAETRAAVLGELRLRLEGPPKRLALPAPEPSVIELPNYSPSQDVIELPREPQQLPAPGQIEARPPVTDIQPDTAQTAFESEDVAGAGQAGKEQPILARLKSVRDYMRRLLYVPTEDVERKANLARNIEAVDKKIGEFELRAGETEKNVGELQNIAERAGRPAGFEPSEVSPQAQQALYQQQIKLLDDAKRELAGKRNQLNAIMNIPGADKKLLDKARRNVTAAEKKVIELNSALPPKPRDFTATKSVPVAPEVKFAYQETDPITGAKKSYFNINKEGHPLHKSSVSRETLQKEGFAEPPGAPPDVPSVGKPAKSEPIPTPATPAISKEGSAGVALAMNPGIDPQEANATFDPILTTLRAKADAFYKGGRHSGDFTANLSEGELHLLKEVGKAHGIADGLRPEQFYRVYGQTNLPEKATKRLARKINLVTKKEELDKLSQKEVLENLGRHIMWKRLTQVRGFGDDLSTMDKWFSDSIYILRQTDPSDYLNIKLMRPIYRAEIEAIEAQAKTIHEMQRLFPSAVDGSEFSAAAVQIGEKRATKEVLAKFSTPEMDGYLKWTRARYNELLKWVNAQRTAIGLEPIKAMPDYFTHGRRLAEYESMGVNIDKMPVDFFTVVGDDVKFPYVKRKEGLATDDAVYFFKKYSMAAERYIRLTEPSIVADSAFQALERASKNVKGAPYEAAKLLRSNIAFGLGNVGQPGQTLRQMFMASTEASDFFTKMDARTGGVLSKIVDADLLKFARNRTATQVGNYVGGNLAVGVRQTGSMPFIASRTSMADLMFAEQEVLKGQASEWVRRAEKESLALRSHMSSEVNRSNFLNPSSSPLMKLQAVVETMDEVQSKAAWIAGMRFGERELGLHGEALVSFADNVAHSANVLYSRFNQPKVLQHIVVQIAEPLQRYSINAQNEIRKGMFTEPNAKAVAGRFLLTAMALNALQMSYSKLAGMPMAKPFEPGQLIPFVGKGKQSGSGSANTIEVGGAAGTAMKALGGDYNGAAKDIAYMTKSPLGIGYASAERFYKGTPVGGRYAVGKKYENQRAGGMRGLLGLRGVTEEQARRDEAMDKGLIPYAAEIAAELTGTTSALDLGKRTVKNMREYFNTMRGMKNKKR